jgi:hypothetical protein
LAKGGEYRGLVDAASAVESELTDIRLWDFADID